MQRKTEITIAIVILVALFVALFLLFRKSEEDRTPVDSDTTVDDVTDVPYVDPVDVPTPQAVSATTIGRTFVERFGSYSTESGYANIDDVVPIATSQLAKRLEDLADDAREAESTSYYGVSTRIITVKTEKETETEVTLLITTQRQESFDSPGNTSVKYQDIRIELKKNGDDWLVDDFTWLEG